ncbi:hypothetical protein CHU92_04945 [Flavobacterium cyanobacteriorum]|uniref:YokE-like PH domain-containing protein n=1 Tax=Flavobacterium cyanobacteriorum TaxID=2022802 RepID=A0A255ZAC7_9FLAO|nr:PH domain-containing protein [Flavobacterium cyanobacteriorum]OYQ38513.1 hypothetical protein CHU92_04945 [Flavobacterium cyanobacteriorum]
MKEHIKNFLNEEQDPKAVEKITSKLNDLLMRGEEVGYIGVQKKPAINVFPDTIVLTNKRIIICKPKNLGLSMEFTDYPWNVVSATFVKENILGSEFSFTTTTDITVTIDYIPKIQARKINTFAREQLELLREGHAPAQAQPAADFSQPATPQEPVAATQPEIEEVETEEVNDFAEIIPATVSAPAPESAAPARDGDLAGLTKEQLFEKLQNYKKLLDNGLILQGEYDSLKNEIIKYL